jgi:hypothetical protein
VTPSRKALESGLLVGSPASAKSVKSVKMTAAAKGVSKIKLVGPAAN